MKNGVRVDFPRIFPDFLTSIRGISRKLTLTPFSKLFEALFEPKTIALIGASGDARKNTSRPQRFLKKHGYSGRVIPINPGRDEIFGEKAYPDVVSVPEPIDHAFIMVPADAVAAALEQCAAKKVTVATVYSDGFAETGAEGRRKQERLLAIARAGGVRLVGPNCIGLVSTEPACALSVNAVLEFAEIRRGPLAIVSQSGSMIGGLMSRGLGRGVGFSKLISVGNEADLGVGEITDLLVDDPHTGTILLFMETMRDADHLARAARRAYAAGKSIIVYKLGRSEVGQDLAASHTGAMAGGDEMADAFFRAHSMLRVDLLETLFELPALVAGQKPAPRHRIAVMTTTGGGAASVVDRLGTFGLDVVAPTDQVVANLAQKNIRISKARLTDLTLAGARKEIYSAVLNELLASDHCDLVLAVVGSSAQFQPQIAVEPIVEAERRGKPLAAFCAPHAEHSLKLLADAGIAGFRTPESCADAIRAWREWTAPVDSPAIDRNKLAAAGALLGESPRVNEYDACRVFAALGVPQAASEIIAAPEQPASVGFPVVAKVLSPDIAHKTDAGGVALNIADAAALRAAAQEILSRVRAKHPGAHINGILVQRMEKGLAEVIVGYKRDPQVGPIVVLGIGGVLAEIYRDFALRLAPVTAEGALRMIEEVKGLAIIRGYRGMPRGDLAALAQTVSAFSQLAALEPVKEAEINPLIVKPEGEGVVAVDGLIVRKDEKAFQ
ncbi:MAG: acetate--CoA ligase family protein [Betaproteobacteria bacterium]|nr:acetate--CoA ligase family protein [Betaproteobacteria bacterium]